MQGKVPSSYFFLWLAFLLLLSDSSLETFSYKNKSAGKKINSEL
mgnify:CR=1 FL=1